MPSKFEFTDAKISALPAPDPSGKQSIAWDLKSQGLGVLVSGASNVKTFVVQGTVDGKTCRYSIGPTDAYKVAVARAEAASKRVDMGNGINPNEQRREDRKQRQLVAAQQAVEDEIAGRTLGQVFADYKKRRKNLSATTLAGYEQIIENHFADWRDQPLQNITQEDVAERHVEIKEKVEKRGRIAREVGKSTANSAMVLLRAIWNLERRLNPLLPGNPVDWLTAERAWYRIEPRDSYIKKSDLPAFYRTVTDAKVISYDPARRYLLLLLFTGMRRNEAAKLEWEHIDFANSTLTVPAINTKAHRKLVLPMTDFVRELLLEQQANRETTSWVFPAEHGKRGTGEATHIQEPRAPLDRVVKTMNEGRDEDQQIQITPHDMRRTFITYAAQTGISPYLLKALVNHARTTDVTGGYIVSDVEALRDVAQTITDHLKALCKMGEEEADNVVPIRG